MLAGARQAIRTQPASLLLGAAVVALLAVAAVGSGASLPSGAPASGTGAFGEARSAGGVMVAAFAAVLVISTALAGVIAYSLMPSRRGKKSPDDVEWVSQQPAISRLEKVLAIALVMLLLAGLVGTLVLVSRSPDHRPQAAAVATRNGQAAGTPAPAAAQKAATTTPVAESARWLELGLGAGGVLVGAAAFAFLVLPRLRRRRSGQETPVHARQRRNAVAEAVNLSLDDLRRESDPRRAIVAAYARMELVLARAGLRRPPHETATEYLGRVLSSASAPPRAVTDLTQLFQEAKFSRHEVTSGQREDALRALSQVRDAMMQ